MVRMLTETFAPGAAGGREPTRVVKLLGTVASATACVLVGGCYYVQAASGEWQVLHERVPIEKVIDDPHTSEALRTHLEKERAARDFASRELGLPDNKSYRSYADIHRSFVAWNVVAAPEFSVQPKTWCFPVAGCVAYRGYFHEQEARDYAAHLAAVEGYDVTVDGVPAYSTLGRFSDPVLSSMLPYGDDELAATVFHELAHQLLYVRDDSEFNEAFATTVEEVGLERWLKYQGEEARIGRYERVQAEREVFYGLLAQTRAQLRVLYASDMPREEMRERKAVIFHNLAGDVRGLGSRKGATESVYEEWLAGGLNNARLASIATYFNCVPGFKRLLASEDNDLERFYSAARELSKEPREKRDAQLCEKRESGG